MKFRNTVLAFVCLGIGFANAFSKQQKPNILFVMSDDHTAQAIGAYGSRLAGLNPTPNIDRLAREGMVFENAFCNNSICTPSRASIMTGQYSHTNGITSLNQPLSKERQYLALEMKKAGYQTAVIGKWHLVARPDAFDYYKVLQGQGDYFDPVFYETGAKETVKKEYSRNGRSFTKSYKGAVQMSGHSTDCVADSALEWFKEKRDPNQPFFLKLHFKAPHDDFEFAPRYADYLEDITIPEPDNLRERGDGSLATRGIDGELERYIGSSVADRHPHRGWLMFLEEEDVTDDLLGVAYQEYLKRYLRCVKGVDDNLGRVLAYMEQEGLMDNTIIIYTGDQGFFLGEHDYIDKRWAYEESMRMPLIVRYPETIDPGTNDALVQNIDFPVTMLDYAGLEEPDYMEGKSFREILETGEEPEDWREAVYYQYWMHMSAHFNPGHIAMRTKRFKLILFHGVDQVENGKKEWSRIQTPAAWELYDLKNDPEEMNNLYDNPEYEYVLAGLKRQFLKLRQEIGVTNSEVAAIVNRTVNEYWDYDEEDRARAETVAKETADRYRTLKSNRANAVGVGSMK
ncbi:sulfatase family protein [Pelagicoccus mobilis]|uniref:Sulfatase n=1 Tax=Pelagicoccus mobilis TaxID=415221 RepID=A0A934VNB4_9BACT|nr:sulfatase [Pelagicoccus mobilis]MBK1876052.1 sulfatase [Pelagicoccus mobilis]